MPATPEPMRCRPRTSSYTGTAIALHWLLAVLILAGLGLGLGVANLPFSPLRLKLMSWHKWLGVTILLASALRLWWRLGHRPPAMSPEVATAMPGWQRLAHRGTHMALYVLFFTVPLLGWAYSSASGVPVVWFGALPLPDLLPVDQALARALLKPLHRYAAYTLAALVLLHVAAALVHQFIHRDGTLARMWPDSRKRAIS